MVWLLEAYCDGRCSEGSVSGDMKMSSETDDIGELELKARKKSLPREAVDDISPDNGEKQSPNTMSFAMTLPIAAEMSS
jgi:hypothetical protein